jgi:hypothetical protein
MSSLSSPAQVAVSAVSMSNEDLECIMDRYPDLSSFGFGVFELEEQPLSDDERAKRLAQNRQTLLEHVDECSFICGWLAQLAKSDSINRRHSSYSLKHCIEPLYNGHVFNGALIAAAIHMGFDVKRSGNSAYFNISEDSLDAVDAFGVRKT